MTVNGQTAPARPPRDNLFRAIPAHAEGLPDGLEFRAEGDPAAPDEGPVMVGHFAVTEQWTEIDSMWEGNFLERFAKGSFKKTMREQRNSMRCLFQHGYDYVVGDKPLGAIDELREDEVGAYYEVPLLDAPYVRQDIMPGLEAELYGASFRFRVLREEFVNEPGESDYNPKGIPERTVKECYVPEFGPVTFPAYEGASAGIRSLTDEFFVRRLAGAPEERLQQLMEFARQRPADTTPPSKTDPPPEDESKSEDNAPPRTAPEPGSTPSTDAATSQSLYGLTAGKETPQWRL